MFFDQLGLETGATTPGVRAMQLTRALNLAMFDKHLRRRPQPVLDGPAACYPEVTIVAR